MCWSNHRAVVRSSTRPARRPMSPANDDLRVSDADRDDTIRLLTRATGEGRLTMTEFEERVDEVLRARTEADLRRARRELPVDRPGPAGAHRPVDLAGWAPALVRLALVVAAVAVVGPWVLWLAIPFFLCGWGRHGHRAALRSGERTWRIPDRDDDVTLV